MTVHGRRRQAALRGAWQRAHALVMIPLGFIVLISVVDLASPTDVHLGPLLVVAPAITASFAGAWLAGLIGALAVAAQVVIGIFHGGLFTTNHETQIIALILVSTVIVLYCRVRERRGRELTRVRSVSETVQRVLLRPLPEKLGPLRLAAFYLAAEDEALLGGDLYAATRVPGAARVLIGDVRGKGLTAVEDAAQVLGAFRELAHHYETLPPLVAALDASFARHLAETAAPGGGGNDGGGDGNGDWADSDDGGIEERFVTLLLVDLPDDPAQPVRIADCGHPPPLLLAEGKPPRVLEAHSGGPPIGLGSLPGAAYRQETFEVRPGEALLLYTDGVVEARDGHRAFYPLVERAARWGGAEPAVLIARLRRDLLAHVGGRLKDDAAAVAIERA